jgi:hypothetical protein
MRELTRLDHPRRPGARAPSLYMTRLSAAGRERLRPGHQGRGRSERQTCASAGSPAAATATARLRLVSSAVQITEPAAKIAAAHQNAVV